MMQAAYPFTRELVLVGGGHTHALFLRRWGMNPLPGARLTLINPGPTAPYTGMLPGFVAGHYAREDLEIDLVRLARFAGARLILDAAPGLNLETQTIQVEGRPPIAFGVASINIGITSDPPNLAAFEKYGIGAKPLGPYAKRWIGFRNALPANSTPAISVIGGGIGGVELALPMAHDLRDRGHAPDVTIIERAHMLAGIGRRSRDVLLQELAHAHIRVIENASVQSVTHDAVVLADNTKIAAEFTVGAAGARPFDWTADTGLETQDGFICVNEHLQTSHPAIFAAGDCAQLPDPRPKAGVFAVREAPVLFDNLTAALAGRSLRAFRPQRRYLKLISLGRQSALADKFGLGIAGPAVWRWKDRIDRRFMEKFQNLPEMKARSLTGKTAQGLAEFVDGKPICTGCGSKVGGAVLSSALGKPHGADRDDVMAAPGDDAAVLQHGEIRQVISTDHLRAFVEDPYLFSKIAAIHALGDIWAMGATPQAALMNVTLPFMEDRLQAQWLSEIMAGAGDVLTAEGAAIAGGHTTLGSEFSIGVTVTGLLGHSPIGLAGAQPGDALLLTKPIGSGVVLAAEMQRKVRGSDWAGTIALMEQSQAQAAKFLTSANAMTDVTGFGLAGHLMNICRASEVSAELNLHSIPLMPGALGLAKQGIRSTLYPANRQVAAEMSVPATPTADLLFDPQTAGGLLACIPNDEAHSTLQLLHKAGYEAAMIGTIGTGAAGIEVLN